MEHNRPGGSLSTRPLHFFWICDCSGSMSVDGKIQSLNEAIREGLPHMRKVAEQNPYARISVRAIAFSHGARWHISSGVELEDFQWSDLEADPLAGGSPKADVVFLVDTSGSMSDEIEAVKQSCQDFADRIIAEGATVRLGLVGFDIGGHRGAAAGYTVHNLSRYTIGTWPLADPPQFKRDVQSLRLGLFGGGGCYLANEDTVDIFPHVVQAFDPDPDRERILVIISDEIGSTRGLDRIVGLLNEARITAHVLGVPGMGGAHEQIAQQTGGEFWSIAGTRGVQAFEGILGEVATTIAQEVTQRLADGTVSSGTDMGAALRLLAGELAIPPMPPRALPPILVMISDGQPTDDFDAALGGLMALPWGKKAVRIGVAIGRDANLEVLEKFIGTVEIKPLQAHNPQELTRYIRWASTSVLAAASAPPSQASGAGSSTANVPLPAPPIDESGKVKVTDVW